MYVGDLVEEACSLANTQFSVDFSQYDANQDGFVDYIDIYK